ncbi:prephenate dehydrogenase [Chloroflexota bacterium]
MSITTENKGKTLQVAIIGGSGKMGRWFARFLRDGGHDVVISGRNPAKLKEAGEQLGVKTAANTEAAKTADVILLSVSIESFADVVRELSPQINPGQTVIDITSVKEFPVTTMHHYLKTPKILGAHPLFGPGAKGFARQNFVLTPTNDTEKALADKVSQYLTERDARVTRMTPQEHDGMMTVILGLAHFIAIVSADTLLAADKLRDMPGISGITYKVLLTLIESVLSEDPELYASLQMHLPGISKVESMFREKTELWTDLVASGNRGEFVRRMQELKKRLEEDAPDFGKAYEKMYKIAQDL